MTEDGEKQVLIMERGVNYDVLDRWMKRLGHKGKNYNVIVTKPEIRAVLRAFGRMAPQPEDKKWKK